MAKFRRRFSVARLCAAVLAVALAFAWLRPWRSALSVAVGMLIPIFVSGLTWAEVATILATGALLGVLTQPSHHDHGIRNPRLRGGPRATTPVPGVVAPIPTPNGRR